MPTALERALAGFRPHADDGGDTRARVSAAEFRAATEQRLQPAPAVEPIAEAGLEPLAAHEDGHAVRFGHARQLFL